MAARRKETTCCGALCSFLVAVGVVVLVYWAIFQPRHVRARVDAATLSNFTVSNASTPAAFSYRLAVSVHLYNPSLRTGIYYDGLDARLRFHGAELGPANETTPPELYQRGKSGDVVRVQFDGRVDGVTGDVAGEYENQKGAGAVSVEVWMDARVRYKLGSVRMLNFKEF